MAVTEVEDDEEIGAGFTEEPDEDEDTEATAGNGVKRGRATSYEDAQQRFNETAKRQLAKYRKYLDDRYDERVQITQVKVQNKLDEWAMAHVGTAQVSDPAAVGSSIVRQVLAAEARLKAFQTQLSELAAAGVDIEAIQAEIAAGKTS